MNRFEQYSLIQECIVDLEKRLGAYLQVTGCEKEDAYAQKIISQIWARQEALCNLIEDSDDG